MEAVGEPGLALGACEKQWPPYVDSSPPIRVSRVYEACCNHQRVSRVDSRLVRLPIQHELTLALVGRVSRCQRSKGCMWEDDQKAGVRWKQRHRRSPQRNCRSSMSVGLTGGAPILRGLHSAVRQKRDSQSDSLCQCQAGLAALGGKTEPVGCGTQSDPHWDGSHISVWGESVSRVGTTGICPAPVASRTNPSVSPTTRVTGQDGPAWRHDHCQSPFERGGTGRLCAKRADSDVPGTGTLAHPTRADETAAYQNEIQALVVVLFPEFTQVAARSLLADCPCGAEPRFPVPRP